MTEKQDELLLTEETIINLVTEYHLSGKQNRHILAKKVAKAQLAKCQAHYHKLMLLEYERGLRDALPAPGTEAYQKIIDVLAALQIASVNAAKKDEELTVSLAERANKILALLGEEK